MMRCLVRKQLKRRRRLIWLLRLERFVRQYKFDMEDEALAYYPGNTSRLKIRVAGGLRSE